MSNQRVQQKIAHAIENAATILSLSNDKLSQVPSEILSLPHLTQLYLRDNALHSLTQEITQLANLTRLDLRKNAFHNLPSEILQLTNLKELYLNNNQLSELPIEIGQLSNLVKLYLGNNYLREIPSQIVELVNLQALDLSRNQLHHLPQGTTQLSNLRELYLRGNLLHSLPPEIKHLTYLTRLDLSHNQLSEVPSGVLQLANLQVLDLRGNQLSRIPPEILQLANLQVLDLRNNPLVHPPMEIAAQGIRAIRAYFESLEDILPLNEVKVLVVGEGSVGKTSLVRRLAEGKFNRHEPQTHGINIQQWQVAGASFKTHVWDFGGQEIMHATHQFFLSKRSVYVLVVDARRDERIEYWLKHIKSFGGDSPIFIVINKIDENPGFDVNRRFLRKKYANIQGFYRLSCANNEGIDRFREGLMNTLAELDVLQTIWPHAWFQVKTKLENMQDSFITYEEYIQLCHEEGVTAKESQDTLVDFLHDLGVILHFRGLDLFDTHVLDPEWVTKAVYRIINSRGLADSKGVLKLSLLDIVLRSRAKGDYQYPRSRWRYIIGLMRKFELCYKINDETYLVPDLLEIQEPEIAFDYNDALSFVIQYDFLPRSIMPHLIVQRHAEIVGTLRWRTGVVLAGEDYQARAIIRSDDVASRIYIYVNGKQKQAYFGTILYTLRGINRRYDRLELSERVAVPDDPKVTISYSHLLRLADRGQETYFPENATKPYNIRELLGMVGVGKGLNEIGEYINLSQKIKNHYDSNEFRTLCFHLGLNMDNLVGRTLANKIEALISHCSRHGRIAELVAICQRTFPHIVWH